MISGNMRILSQVSVWATGNGVNSARLGFILLKGCVLGWSSKSFKVRMCGTSGCRFRTMLTVVFCWTWTCNGMVALYWWSSAELTSIFRSSTI